MAQLRARAALPEGPYLGPSTHAKKLTAALTAALEDPASSSGLCGHLYNSWCSFTQICIHIFFLKIQSLKIICF